MPSNLDPAARFSIECPKCGHKFERSIGGVKGKPIFSCPHCGQLFDGKDFNAGVKQVDKAIDDFVGDIDGMKF
jgi:uncharacterized C2H2 Zn-finger protein